MTNPILTVKDLQVSFTTSEGLVHAVNGVDCELYSGECLGIVGESGSGKSQTFLAVMNLLAKNATVSGAIHYKGSSLLNLSRQQRNTLLGDRLSMIFQDPLTSLTPHMKIGEQMREVLSVHKRMGRKEAEMLCLEWLDRVRIPDAKQRIDQYPHELSGGMRQRVMIAMTMLCKPDILIADEPSTALDVTVQADILDLMNEFRTELGTAIVLITHDMGVVARMCQRVSVMQAGYFVEQGTVDEIFYQPSNEYTRMLLAAVPKLTTITDSRSLGAKARSNKTLISAKDLVVDYKLPGTWLKRGPSLTAVNQVSLSVSEGETLGIVGESGSGKSTLARSLIRLQSITSGHVAWLGSDLHALNAQQLRQARSDMQIVFQDPLASLDPTRTIGYSISEPLGVHEPELTAAIKKQRVLDMMHNVGLDSGLYTRYPHELSGGQNQRVGIARAMIISPKLVICDEAVSALDVSIQAQIINLLKELQRRTSVAIVFISHDLSVVSNLADRVMVMYLGAVVELADANSLFHDARHPYTQQLISAVPIPDPKIESQRHRIRINEVTVSALDPASRLRFMPSKLPIDPNYVPRLLEVSDGHWVAEHDTT